VISTDFTGGVSTETYDLAANGFDGKTVESITFANTGDAGGYGVFGLSGVLAGSGGFVGDPDADLDGNGVADLVDHALTDNGSLESAITGGTLTYQFTRKLAADDVTILLQVSDDLEIWTDAASIFNSPTSTLVEPGGEQLIYSASMLSLPNTSFFVRLQVTLNSP
jgi:hypothetical protein